jgi:polysaccharide pyruvyl transferase WcaK-like protein
MMLRQEFLLPRFTIASYDYRNDRLIDLGRSVRVVPSRIRGVWEPWTGPWMVRRLLQRCSAKKAAELYCLPVTAAMASADAVLSVGGDNFSMDYGYPFYFMELNRLARERNKKLVIWGATIGPFPEDGRLNDIVASLRQADLITARESATVRYLRRIGITDNVRQTADPAFLLPLQAVPDECLRSASEGVLGLNVSRILSSYNKSGRVIDVIQEISSFLRRVVQSSGLRIALVPHVIDLTSDNNDYAFMQGIYDALKDTGRIYRIPPAYNALQLKYLISRCRFFIGARTHSTIAALSSGVPTLSIGYSLKSRGINEDIFGHQEYALRIDDLSAGELFRRFSRMRTDESTIRQRLSVRIPEIMKMARQNVRYLKELLKT